MFALMTNILQFAWWKVKGKKHLSTCNRLRPVFVLMVATVLVCTQPVCMLVIGSWDSIDNFFFDGADANNFCKKGDGSDCQSGFCGSGAPHLVKNPDTNAIPRLQYIWDKTGCIRPKADDQFEQQMGYVNNIYGGGSVADAQKGIYDACSKKDDILYGMCHFNGNATSKFTKCTMMKPVDPAVDFSTCFPDAKETNGGVFAITKYDGKSFSPTPFLWTTSTCACGMDSGALVPNTTIGWLIQIFGTYGGFGLMFVGVFEATQLHLKIMKKWRKLRGN